MDFGIKLKIRPGVPFLSNLRSQTNCIIFRQDSKLAMTSFSEKSLRALRGQLLKQPISRGHVCHSQLRKQCRCASWTCLRKVDSTPLFMLLYFQASLDECSPEKNGAATVVKAANVILD